MDPVPVTTVQELNPLEGFIPPREIPRRRLIHSGIAQQKFRKAVIEAAAEISTEFTVQ
jgi:hypothetical protein